MFEPEARNLVRSERLLAIAVVRRLGGLLTGFSNFGW